MANILFYDLTSQPYSRIFQQTLEELKKYRPVTFQKVDVLDPTRARLGELVERSYEPRRRQVNTRNLLHRFMVHLATLRDLGRTTQQKLLEHERVILLEKDIFSTGNNWIFGAYTAFGPFKFLVSSMKRMTSDAHVYDHLLHELGHMYGAPSRGRDNTTQNLGLHCINDLCVMQQRTSVTSAVKYVKQRLRAKASDFCHQCQDDLRVI